MYKWSSKLVVLDFGFEKKKSYKQIQIEIFLAFLFNLVDA